ncbi:uncharacterized protein LOC126973587 [Leptidea sinapis]|uniref:uncharacterized protein LOC126973587 n=1 Tax=Leptidea sinapis TaxID=189913 RepID=UPI0021C2A9EA|nr:uncharacterized protein LOC126973587 [Leptidea sinapis]
MGARLYEKAIGSLRLQIRQVTFWTDSTIVLGWLNMLPSKLNTFVRNRVAEIVEKTNPFPWRHVPTGQNPADFITRGVGANLIKSLDPWWCGPEFLQLEKSGWPNVTAVASDLPETRPEITLHTMKSQSSQNSIIEFHRFSNFTRLQRSVAYMLRFINRCKRQIMPTSYLGEDELRNSLYLIIQMVQKESFPEYELLLNKQKLPPKSSLNKFNIFLDKNNIIRVGGRLNNSQFLYDKKYPILIQSTHRFTKLLFQHEHKRLMHAGPQLLLATIREMYWPIGGRNLARICYHQCVLCRRMKGQTVNPIMGNYPQQRLVVGEHPFTSVGVDYAGPITAASRQGRGCRFVKVYIAIFICFTTKAIHLELVGDLTSNNYLSALRRFIARRGKPSNMYSDNGTTFVGAYNELSKFLKSNCDSIAEGAVNEGINIHYIPAYSPHFGGLWEAGVKSTKYHLVRVLGNCHLTYEELNTTLVQIEALLNSRPLTPLSSEPDDLMPLTPGHFLIGRPFTSLPTSDLTDQCTSHLSRYQRIEQLRQHFWNRWSKEYISELQTRSKWQLAKSEVTMGSLVVVKDDHLPPLKWRFGRVVGVHPGSDGVTRVADVKCSNGILRRAVTKICPLPICTEDAEGGGK